MPTVTYSKKELESLLGKKLPLEELKDRISMLGTDLEGIEGDEIKVEIFPNRPDLLSLQGFARALASFIGIKGKTGLKQYNVKQAPSNDHKVIVEKSVTMRPFTACAIVKNLKLTNQNITDLMQVQEKLATTHGRNRKKSAYGIYPLDKINFPVKYTAKDPSKVSFKPLGLEGKEIKADQIEELHPKAKAYKHVAQGWKKYPFFIDAKDNVMCMLPYTNSEDTGKVTTETKEVFIECSGTDLNNVQVALNILTTTMVDMGGTIYELPIEYEDFNNSKKAATLITPNLSPKEIPLNLESINKLLGLNLTQKDAKKWLERMGFRLEQKESEDQATILIPAYRNDILHSVDLAEDIAIAYGYENFEAIIPEVATIAQESPLSVFTEKLRQRLIGLGLLEIKNYHLIKKEECTQFMNKAELDTATLSNSLGDHNTLRPNLISSLLKTYAINAHHEYPQNIFETGRIFQYENKKHEPKQTETGINETEYLSVGLCSETADFTAIRQVLDMIARETDLNLEVKESEDPSFIPGRVGVIKLTIKEGKKSQSFSIGTLGEIHPQVLDNWNIKMPVVALELNTELLLRAVQENNN